MRDSNIYVRVTEEEKITLNEEAAEEGLTLSKYIRMKLGQQPDMPDEVRGLKEIIKESKDNLIKTTKARDFEFIILRKLVGLLILNSINTEDIFSKREEKFVERIAKEIRHILIRYRMDGKWS